MRASLHPLDVVRAVHGRRVDAGLGYSLTSGLVPAKWVSGPFLMGEYFVWRKAVDPRNSWRLGAVGTAGLQFMQVHGRRENGFAGSIGVDLERAGTLSGSASGHQFVLGAHGEWSIGPVGSASRTLPLG